MALFEPLPRNKFSSEIDYSQKYVTKLNSRYKVLILHIYKLEVLIKNGAIARRNRSNTLSERAKRIKSEADCGIRKDKTIIC